MTIRFNLNASVRLENIEISGESKEEIYKKLHELPVAKLLQDCGAYERDDDYTDIESEIVSCGIRAHVTDIEFDVDEDDLLGTGYDTVKEFADNLPSTLEITAYVDNENENDEDALRAEIYALVGFNPKKFNYKIVKRF